MNRFERLVLWVPTALVTLSGVGFAVLKYLVVSDDPFAVVNHPWQPIFLKMHVLSAPLLVFGVGVVFSKHIWRHWNSRPAAGRRTGGTAFLLLVPMVVTGYLIQTVTRGAVLRWIVAIHLLTGGAYLLAILGHHLRTALLQRAARRRDPAIAAPDVS